jgi:hypothetical protein
MKEAFTASYSIFELTVRLPLLPGNIGVRKLSMGLAGRGPCEKLFVLSAVAGTEVRTAAFGAGFFPFNALITAAYSTIPIDPFQTVGIFTGITNFSV